MGMTGEYGMMRKLEQTKRSPSSRRETTNAPNRQEKRSGSRPKKKGG